MTSAGGLAKFADQLAPAAADAIAAWADHPELGKLHAKLEAITDRDPFLNARAEAVLARHLVDRGCVLRVDVPTPAGRTCDLEASRDGRQFFLHVKRLNPAPRPRRGPSTVPSRLRYLERVERPYVVGVRLRHALTDEQAQVFVTSAAEFIRHARLGDEMVIRDGGGVELGGCRIVSPWEGPTVCLDLSPAGFADEVERARRLLRRAYRQFMPKATNVIQIESADTGGADDVATALLGSHIERWDAVPPRGHRVAHGRDADGFWHGTRAGQSQAAGWFSYTPAGDALESQLWIRSGASIDMPTRTMLDELLGS